MTDLTNTRALQQQLTDAGVKYALASYVDIHGVSKGKFVPVAHLGQIFPVTKKSRLRYEPSHLTYGQ